MRILVTGASGLIGKALVERLRAEGQTVHSSSRSPADAQQHSVADLASYDEVQSLLQEVLPSVVVHLAGRSTGDRHELYRANTLTAVNVTSAAAALPRPPHLILAGSAAEYGQGVGENIQEDDPLQPLTEYGRAKAAATTLAEVLAEGHGLQLTVVRPFNVVSCELPPGSALGNLRRQLFEQDGAVRTIRCGRLDVIRDFVPLQFVIDALRYLTINRSPGIYNVCSGVGISLGSVLDAMAELLGVKLRIEHVPELLSLPAADRVVGNPQRLASVGLAVNPSPESLGRACLNP